LILSSGTSSVSSGNPSGVSYCPQPSTSGNISSSTSYSTYLDLFEEEYLSDDHDLQEAISRSLDLSASER
ncbi:hypothetical protein UPYG_G00043560, partial [Umbra pygmaea]